MSKQIVALTKTACPICAQEESGDLILSKRLRDISHLDGQVTDWKLCDECKAGMAQGAVMTIIIDKDLCSGYELHEIYRCGEVYGLTKDAIRRMITDKELAEEIIQKQVFIMDYRDAKQVGLPVKYKS